MAQAQDPKSDPRPSMVMGGVSAPALPSHLVGEETVTMVFPHDLSLNLDDYAGLIHFKKGIQEVPISLVEGHRVKTKGGEWSEPGLHWYLKQQGVVKYKKSEPAGPEITEHHIKFLQSKGYAVTTVEGAAEFVKRLTGMEAAGFFAEAKDWVPESNEIEEDEESESTEESVEPEAAAEDDPEDEETEEDEENLSDDSTEPEPASAEKKTPKKSRKKRS